MRNVQNRRPRAQGWERVSAMLRRVLSRDAEINVIKLINVLLPRFLA